MIREYFFFDGERLDRYFKDIAGQNIRSAIFQISQIDLLERVSTRLKKLLNDLETSAGKNNPDIERVRKQIEDMEGNLVELDTQVKDLQRQKAKASSRKSELDDILIRYPDIESEERDKKEYEKNQKIINEELEKKTQERKNYLFKTGTLVMFSKAVIKTLEIIEDGVKKIIEKIIKINKSEENENEKD